MHIRAHAPITTKAVDALNLTVDFIVSTASLDSHGTRIDQSGWILDQFKRNPVITWAHDDRGFTPSGGLPVANAIPDTVKVEGGALKMRMKFTPENVNPFGYRIFQMIKEGYLHASSVGFEPMDDELQDEDGQKVRVYKKSKLLEVAIVTIPSNDDALAQRAKELNKDPEKAKEMAAEVEKLAEERIKKHAEEFDTYKQYFERKQPANKASAKVLEKFYKLRNEKVPTDEVEAWERMGKQLQVKPSADLKAERTASVQLSPEHINAIVKAVSDVVVGIAVTASRQGVPSRELGAFIDSTAQKTQELSNQIISSLLNGTNS